MTKANAFKYVRHLPDRLHGPCGVPHHHNARSLRNKADRSRKTYGDVVTEYEFHPEAKCADASGNTCEKQTTGLLQRRHIKIDFIKCIGKESNSLESVDEGMVHSQHNVYTDYADPRRTEWIVKISPP